MSCHPSCSWACNDPTMAADCTPECLPPSCTIEWRSVEDDSLYDGTPPGCQEEPNASISCPSDACELEGCPTCEIVAEEVTPCSGYTPTVLCEQVNCSWNCQYPADMPAVDCELQCESPACIADGSYAPIMSSVTSTSNTTSTTSVGLGQAGLIGLPEETFTPSASSDESENGNMWRGVSVALIVLVLILIGYIWWYTPASVRSL